MAKKKLIDTTTLQSFWNGFKDKLHTHSNKDVLDATTAAFTTAYEHKLNNNKIKSPIERIGLFWGDDYFDTDVEYNANFLSTLDIVGLSAVNVTEDMKAVITRMRELNPDIRLVRYVDAGTGKTREQMYSDIEQCVNYKGITFDGIFLDQFDDLTNCGEGKEYIDSIHRQNDLIDKVHELGMFVIGNAWDFLSHVSGEVNSWNTLGIKTNMNSKDYWLIESCSFYPEDDINNKNYNYGHWAGINSMQKLYTYYNQYYDENSAHAIDFSSSGKKLTEEEKQYALTWLCYSTLARGGRSICFDRGNLLQNDTDSLLNKYYYDNPSQVVITNEQSGVWQIKVNGHTIKCIVGSKLSGIADIKSFDNVHIFIDGQETKNDFYFTGNIVNKISKVEDKIEETIENTNLLYNRAFIDDWQPENISLSLFDNLLLDNMELKTVNGIYTEDLSFSNKVVNINGNYSDWTSWGNCDYEVKLPDGYNDCDIEFGAEYFTYDNDNLKVIITNDVDDSSSEITCNSKEISSAGNNGENRIVGNYHIPKDATKLFFTLKCFGGNYGTNLKWSLENLYIVRPSDINSILSKQLYTNIFPISNYSATNLGSYTMTDTKYLKYKAIQVHIDATEGWGALRKDITGAFVENLRGHTLELCAPEFTNTGSNQHGIRLIVGSDWSANGVYPDTLESSEILKSIGVEERIPSIKYKVPDDATQISVGFQGYGGTGEINATVILADLDEEGIVERGVDPSNTYLKINRINEEFKNEKYENNSIYVTDKGRMFVTDFYGNTTDIGMSQYPVFEEADSLSELSSGEHFSSLLGKIKLAIKNVIKIIRQLGSTDISSIGDGTITNAISSLSYDLNNAVITQDEHDNETPDLERRDSDTLGGTYTANDIDNAVTFDEELDSEIVDDIKVTDADRLGGVYTKEDITKIVEDVLEAKGAINSLNLNLVDRVLKRLDTYATSEYGRHITDALSIDISNRWGEENQTGYVYETGTVNMPTECSFGFREFLYYNQSLIFVRIQGWHKRGYPAIWFNLYNGATWVGWTCIDQGIQSVNLSGNNFLKGKRIGKLAILHFDSFEFPSDGGVSGSVNVGLDFAPDVEGSCVFCPVTIAGRGGGNVALFRDGHCVLYNETMNEYVGGKVYGSISYIALH